jgi:ATP-dependent DNA helicase RecG
LEQIIIFYYRNKNNTSKRAKEIRILHAIKENPKVKTNELALMLGVSVRTIKSLIATLKKNKVIERIGGKRFGYWKISEK